MDNASSVLRQRYAPKYNGFRFPIALFILLSCTMVPSVRCSKEIEMLTEVDDIVESLAVLREGWKVTQQVLPTQIQQIQSNLDDKLQTVSQMEKLKVELAETMLEVENLRSIVKERTNVSGETNHTSRTNDECSELTQSVENRYVKQIEDLMRTMEDLQRQVKISDQEIGEIHEASQPLMPLGSDELSQELYRTFIETERVKLLGASLESKDGLELMSRNEESNKLLEKLRDVVGEDHDLSLPINEFSELLHSTMKGIEKRLSGIEAYRLEIIQILRQKDALLRGLQAALLETENDTEMKLKGLDKKWQEILATEKDQLHKENTALLQQLEHNALIWSQENKQAVEKQIQMEEVHLSLLEQVASLESEKQNLQKKLATVLGKAEKDSVRHEQEQNESSATIKNMKEKCQLAVEEQQGIVAEMEKIVAIFTAENERLKNELSSLEGNYDELLNVMDKAAELYSEQHFDQVLQEKTQLITKEWKQKFEDLEAKTNNVLAQAEDTTKQALDIFRAEAQKKMDFEISSYQKQLSEQEAKCKQEREILSVELAETIEVLEKTVEELRLATSNCS